MATQRLGFPCWLLSIGCVTSPDPAIRITSPARDATVAAGTDSDRSVQISFVVEHFTLRPPGTCGDISSCGYIRVALADDQGNCDAFAHGINNVASSSPTYALLSHCTELTGRFVVFLDLLTDSGAAVDSTQHCDGSDCGTIGADTWFYVQ